MAGTKQDPTATYSEVRPGLLISGWRPAADERFLRERGVRCVVRMFPGDDPCAADFEGIEYCTRPAQDHPDYDIHGDALAAADTVAQALRERKTVLVHCHAGVSRSATAVLYYLMLYEGRTLREAADHLAAARPVACPNPGFLRRLKRLDDFLAQMRR